MKVNLPEKDPPLHSLRGRAESWVDHAPEPECVPMPGYTSESSSLVSEHYGLLSKLADTPVPSVPSEPSLPANYSNKYTFFLMPGNQVAPLS